MCGAFHLFLFAIFVWNFSHSGIYSGRYFQTGIEICVGNHVTYLILTNTVTCRQHLDKLRSIKFNENLFSTSRAATCGGKQTGRQI